MLMISKESTPPGVFVGDAAIAGIAFGGAYDLIGHLHAVHGIANGHGGADGYAAGGEHALVNDPDVTELVFQSGDIIFVFGLFILGRIILGVFAEIAKSAGDLEHLCNLQPPGGLHILQLLFALFYLFFGKPNLCHL